MRPYGIWLLARIIRGAGIAVTVLLSAALAGLAVRVFFLVVGV